MLTWSFLFFFFFSSRRRHTRLTCDWSSDVCSSDLDPRLEPAKLLLLGEEIEVADLPVARIDAELVREPPEDVDALQGKADLGLGRELNADAACRLAGRARADAFALEEDDVAEPAAGQVVGDRAAHHAAADDHRAGRPRQAHEAGI